MKTKQGELPFEEIGRETLPQPIQLVPGDSIQFTVRDRDTGRILEQLDPVQINEACLVEQEVVYRFRKGFLGLKNGYGVAFGEIG